MASIEKQFNFSIPFFKTNLDFTDKALDAVNQFVEDQPDVKPHEHWLCQLTTNVKTLDRFLPVEIEAYIASLAEEIFKDSTVYINEASGKNPTFNFHYWFNKYKRGDFQEPHDHSPKHLSAVWYLKGRSQDTVFLSPHHYWPFTSDVVIPELETGDIIFFPSGLIHHVLPCTEDDRVTIAFDFFDVRF